MPLSVTSPATANSTTSTSTLTLTVSASVGDLLILSVAADNSGTAGVSSTSTSVTDTGSNTWVSRGQVNKTGGTIDDGTTLSLWTCKVTSALSGGTVTVNFSPNTTSKAAAIRAVSTDNANETAELYLVGAGGSGNGTSWSSGTISNVPRNSILFGFSALENTTTGTADSDTTNGSWSTRQTSVADTGTATTSQALCNQYKIITATGDQSYDSTTATSKNYAWNWLIVYPAATLSISDLAASASSTTNSSTLAITSVTASVGTWLVVMVGADNNGTSGVSSISSVTDSVGNTYTQQFMTNRTAAGAAADGATAAIFTTKVETALSSGTVTVNFSPNTDSKAAMIKQIQGSATGATIRFDTVGAGVTGSSTTFSTSNVVVPNKSAIIGLIALQGTQGPTTTDTDTTNGSWTTVQTKPASTGTTATSMAISAQHKITTDYGNQSWDTSIGAARQYALNYLVLHAEYIGDATSETATVATTQDAIFTAVTTNSESVALGTTDSQAGSTYNTDRTESFTSGESSSNIITTNVTITETFTSGESSTRVNSTNSATTESFTSGESSTAIFTAVVSNTESFATGESSTRNITTPADRTESFASGESSTNTLLAAVSLTESFSTGESSTRNITTPADRTESFATGESSTVLISFSAASTESFASGESSTVIISFAAASTESFASGESSTTQANFVASNTETITVDTTQPGNIITSVTNTESFIPGENSVITNVILSDRTETVTVGESSTKIGVLVADREEIFAPEVLSLDVQLNAIASNTESIALTATHPAIYTTSVTIFETISPSETNIGSPFKFSDITESIETTTTSDRLAIFNSDITENINSGESSTKSNIASSLITESFATGSTQTNITTFETSITNTISVGTTHTVIVILNDSITENITLTVVENSPSTYSVDRTETIAVDVTSQRGFFYYGDLTETITPGSTSDRQRTQFAIASGTIILYDTQLKSAVIISDRTESLTLAESDIGGIPYSVSRAESGSLASSQSGVKISDVLTSDSLSSTDISNGLAIYNKQLGDIIVASNNQAGDYIRPGDFIATLDMLDTVQGHADFVSSKTETVSISDTLQAISQYYKQQSETGTATSSETALSIYIRTRAESIPITAFDVTGKVTPASISELANAVESQAARFDFNPLRSESLNALDSITSHYNFVGTMIVTGSIVDTVASNVIYPVSHNESGNATSTISSFVAFVGLDIETLVANETLTSVATFVTSINEVLAALEFQTPSERLHTVSQSDTLNIVDTLNLDYFVTMSEAISAIATAIVQGQFNSQILESVNAVDSSVSTLTIYVETPHGDVPISIVRLEDGYYPRIDDAINTVPNRKAMENYTPYPHIVDDPEFTTYDVNTDDQKVDMRRNKRDKKNIQININKTAWKVVE